ncbi:MAG: sugar phosphate isomerase/epimerase [Rhodothermales bacterium]|nr:sugar phosphate isomerase/epimerase [Rhodothermales bacterium]
MSMNRRNFLHRTAGLAAASLFTPQLLHAHIPAPIPGGKIAFQTWVVREQIAQDFVGTMKKMVAHGYSGIELCSPPSYEKSGFAPLLKYSGKELKRILDGEGIHCESSHYNFAELRDHLPERIAFAKDMGYTQMVASSLGLGKEATMDDWKKAADTMNRLGEQTKAAGIQLGFHNHHGEFEKIDGTLIYDVLLERFDTDLVKLQFQVAVVNIGYKAADYFRAHPGRFISAHLADWSPAKESAVAIGEGVVDWKDFFDAAKVGGLNNVYVEMDPAVLPASASYLKKMG